MQSTVWPTLLPFDVKIKNEGLSCKRNTLKTLQVNLGKLCNQACHHCHVEAGPKRTEIMSRQTMDRILEMLCFSSCIETVDLTGGAPELNPNFKYFVTELKLIKKKVIDRCNLTVLYEPNQNQTAEFLRDHQVQIVASLPCYSKKNVDRQRGNGVFDKSIRALQWLNQLGYGSPGTGLSLNLVYNPQGAFLPPAQEQLEKDYKKELKELFGIEFNQLFTITNMPIKRFLKQLEKAGELYKYQELLVQSFNSIAAQNIMCRELVSIGWEGSIYDCDFNQMLEIPLGRKLRSIWSLGSFEELLLFDVAFENHCYGCTAGSGSSCGGALL